MKKTFLLSLLIMSINTITMNVFAQTAPAKKAPVLNHVALFVQNLGKSAQFYRDIIGLDTMPEPFKDGKHAWFRTGPHSSLHVIEGASEPAVHPKNHHTCFSVPSMNEFVANLQKNKIEYEDHAGKKSSIHRRVDGVQQIWLQDPDGYWIEINDDKY